VRSRSRSYRARELNFLTGASFDLSEALLDLLKIRKIAGIRANVAVTDGAFAIDHVGSTPANAFESSELVVQTLIVAAHPAVVVAQKCERKPQVFPPSREHKRAVCGNAKDTAVEIFIFIEVVPHGTQFLTSLVSEGERHEK
jgi:hypothetical protein